MNKILIALALVLSAAIAVPAMAEKGKAKGKGKRPDVIQLPAGFGPEGITTAKRHTFFVGGRDTGEIYKGSLRTGEGATLVEGVPQVGDEADDRAATGLKVDKYGRLFVSGADSQHIRVYDSRTGDEIRDYPVDSGFINDNVVTKQGVYFTDSQKQQLYFIPFGKKGALGALETIPITGDFVYGPGFNANGIEKAKGGKTLILIQSSTGNLYTADAATGKTEQITLERTSGTDNELDDGDGLLRKGRKLFVVENQDNRVTVVKLGRDLSSARIVDEIDSDLFEVPTTIARSGGRNYVVNAKFGSNTPTQTYEVVKVPRK